MTSEPIDWTGVLIGGTGAVLVGWILGLVTTPVADWIHRLWRGPRLTLDVASHPHEFSFTESDSAFGQHKYREVYINVEVSNDKSRTAENCRAWLVNIEKESEGRLQSTGFGDSFPLIWAYDPKAESVPIPKGVARRVNVITIRDDRPGFTPRFRGDNGEVLSVKQYDPLFADNGKFRFTVLVSAQEAPTYSRRFCVERNDGQWPPTVWSCE